MAKLQNATVESQSTVDSIKQNALKSTEITLSKKGILDGNTVLSGIIVISDKISSDFRAKIMKTKASFSEKTKEIESLRETTYNNCKVNGKLNEQMFFDTWNKLTKEETTVKFVEITNEEFDILLSVNTERNITAAQLEILMMIFDKMPK